MVALRFDSFRQPTSRRRLLICGLFAVILILVYHSIRLGLPSIKSPHIWGGCLREYDPDPPANWDNLWKWEDDLPQHDVDLPFPEGNTGRYVYFKNQNQLLGWNNQLNEMYVHSSSFREAQANKRTPRSV